jgi:hypothetical protein
VLTRTQTPAIGSEFVTASCPHVYVYAVSLLLTVLPLAAAVYQATPSGSSSPGSAAKPAAAVGGGGGSQPGSILASQ